MMKDEEIKVKNAAKHLLRRLVEEQPKIPVQDGYKDSLTQNRVKAAAEELPDRELAWTYGRELFMEKATKVFDPVYEYSSNGMKRAAWGIAELLMFWIDKSNKGIKITWL